MYQPLGSTGIRKIGTGEDKQTTGRYNSFHPSLRGRTTESNGTNRQFYCRSLRCYRQGIRKPYPSQLAASQERQTAVLQKVSEQFGKHADVINQQGKQLTALYQIHQRDYKKLLQLIQLYSELSTCGVMDGKRKENLKTEIVNLINT